MPDLVFIVLNNSNGSQFLINKDKNKGSFLLTFPHPSLNWTRVWVNSPWALSEYREDLITLGTLFFAFSVCNTNYELQH
jgi:hypothetical protein